MKRFSLFFLFFSILCSMLIANPIYMHKVNLSTLDYPNSNDRITPTTPPVAAEYGQGEVVITPDAEYFQVEVFIMFAETEEIVYQNVLEVTSMEDIIIECGDWQPGLYIMYVIAEEDVWQGEFYVE